MDALQIIEDEQEEIDETESLEKKKDDEKKVDEEIFEKLRPLFESEEEEFVDEKSYIEL